MSDSLNKRKSMIIKYFQLIKTDHHILSIESSFERSLFRKARKSMYIRCVRYEFKIPVGGNEINFSKNKQVNI